MSNTGSYVPSSDLASSSARQSPSTPVQAGPTDQSASGTAGPSQDFSATTKADSDTPSRTGDEPALAKKASTNKNQDLNTPSPNPKAAAKAMEEEEDRPLRTAAESRPASAEKNPVAPLDPPFAKTVAAPRTEEAGVKSTQPAVPVRKDPKVRAAKADSSGGNKADGDKKDDKAKKGGFFKVFKKIFGKS